MEQVREAIGVTLSVLCSNIQLYASLDSDHSREGGNSDVNYHRKEGSWVQFLIERASELVVTIQNTSQSDNSEILTDARHQSRYLSGDSKDDVKWMETVLIFTTVSIDLL